MSRPTLGVLFSAGKDSTLAALLLEPHYDVTLVTGSFVVTEDWQHARETAARLDLPFERLELDREVASEAVDQMAADGYPRNGIQRVHEHALETIAKGSFDAIADGTRRDDRVPSLSRSAAQSLEDRHEVPYLRPLAGIGRAAVDQLVETTLEVTTGESQRVPRADYEAELRALLADRDGEAAIEHIFPDHTQSVVRGRK